MRIGDIHYLVEVEADNALDTPEVQAKREAARSWARKVTDVGDHGTSPMTIDCATSVMRRSWLREWVRSRLKIAKSSCDGRTTDPGRQGRAVGMGDYASSGRKRLPTS